MRKVKLTINTKVPSWHFCNLDGFTPDDRISKELCRFAVKTKGGYRCILYDEVLAQQSPFVHKTNGCIKMTAGFSSAVDDRPAPVVDPQKMIKESLKLYNKTLTDLINQGYPRAIAEDVAIRYVTGGN